MSIKPAHTISYGDLLPGDPIIIGFQNASVHGGHTEGRVTVVSVGEQELTAQWPDDPPGRTFRYKTAHLTKLERAEAP